MGFKELGTAVSLALGCLLCLKVTCSADNFIEDYCWRDYNGITPRDAFQAGYGRDGKPIYIGQTLFENKLIPGKIHEDKGEIHVEFARVYTLNETIKILCTKHPEKFEWVKTRYDEILSLKDKHLFEGGYEKKYITYVGRAMSHGELTVGKVICFDDGCYKLTTTENGTWYDHGEFEILTYNPDAKPAQSSALPVSKPHRTSKPAPNNPSFLTYFFLVLMVAGLVVLIIVLVRRC